MPGYDLKSALKRVTTRPSHFVLIKGAKGEQVVISPQPPSAQVLTPVMEECGAGKRVAAGICLLEDDQLVFATKSAPAPAWAAVTSKALKAQQCGQYLPAAWRQMGESESDESTGEESGATENTSTSEKKPEPTAESGTELMKRFQIVLPKIKAAIAAAGPASQDLKLKAAEAAAFAKKKDFVEAARLLDEIDTLLATTAVAAPTPKPTVDPAALFTKRLQVLLPKIKAAIAAAGPSALDIKLKTSEAGVFAKKKDFAQANRLLDEAAALLKDAESEQEETDSAETGGEDAENTPGKGKNQPAPKIAYAQVRLGWDGARKRAATDVARLEKSLLDLFQDDPNISDLQQKVRKLDTILAQFDESLGDVLDKAYNAEDVDKPKIHQEALALVSKYRAYVDGDPFIKAVVANPFAPVTFQKDLSSTLAQVASQLAA